MSNDAQHTLQWYRARIGRFTGSSVGLLMKAGRKADFSDTALSYIYQVAAEREMNPAVIGDDALFARYLETVNVTSRAMQWGNEQEACARQLYEDITGRRMVEVPLCAHPTIPHFASSPDGFHHDEDTGQSGCLEIKCPTQATFMKYRCEVHDAPSLLATKYEYYYQCLAHMMCTGAQWTDFVVYNPFQAEPLHITRIQRDEEAFARMEERITMADRLIGTLTHKTE